MKATALLSAVFFLSLVSAGQTFRNKMLFIIDSIPIITDPEIQSRIPAEEIAAYNIITNPDSIKLLGWSGVGGITIIFTKRYRNRPDSLKKIPSLRQMKSENGIWKFRGTPYTGRFIDYYTNGSMYSEGNLVNGKREGKVRAYFKSGALKSVSDYSEGSLDGEVREYYKNGSLHLIRGFSQGKATTLWEEFFSNGQKLTEKRPKKDTKWDTLITYYSTGRVNETRLMKNGVWKELKRITEMNSYSFRIHQNLRENDLKTANQNFYRLWRMDSTSAAIHFTEGLLLMKEGRFDAALVELDRALLLEPLMKDALIQRAFARWMKYGARNIPGLPAKKVHNPIPLPDLETLPADEVMKICSDFVQADELDPTDLEVKNRVGPILIEYCQKKMYYKN